ncbi:MAG: rRNA maturation RNase YbeY [Deltaproteobacteria bacterium]|nr:rRNA maturation RNase YbeY [Deltaproteobacteria bacterium]
MKIWIRNRQKPIPLDVKKIRRVVQKILAKLGLPEAELSLLLVDDKQIQELNLRFLGRDKTTNVLAFSMREGEYSSLHPHLLGDLVISIETTKRQSKQSGLNEMEMLTLLLIHGILHLLGYEHEGTRKGAKEMSAKQKQLFQQVIQA